MRPSIGVAQALIGLGIQKGDHIAVWATNWPKWILLQFATARIGAVMVLINPAYRTSELSYVLKQSDAVALFLVDAFRASDYFAMVNEAIPELAGRSRASCADRVSPPAARRFDEADRDARHVGVGRVLSPGRDGRRRRSQGVRIASSRRASRSTCNTRRARPVFRKGPCWPIGICCSTRFTSARASGSLGDRICIPVPFYHCFGCVLGTLCSAVYGAAMVIPAEYFDPEATLERDRIGAGDGGLRRPHDVHRPAASIRRSPAAI